MPPLPELVLSKVWQQDFDAAAPPCFALGIAEIGGRRMALMALKPDRGIPRAVFARGMALGHGLVGKDGAILIRFGFHFYEFACFTVLINPANPLMRPILAAMAETGDYLFIRHCQVICRGLE